MTEQEQGSLYEGLLTVTPSPHIKHTDTTARVMLHVLIALMPAFIWGIVVFGWNAAIMPLVAVGASVLFEYLVQKLLRKPVTVGDLSAAVTGLLLGLNLPASDSYFLPVVGAAFAIVVVKQLFGGIGKNFVNPALAGRAFMFSWPVAMSTWVKVGFANAASPFGAADVVTAATPLSFMHQGQLPDVSVMDAFLGNVGGCIGETSALLLLIGFVYLLARKVLTARIPLAYIGTVAVLSFLFPMGHGNLQWMAYQLFTGGLMLGAIFMATDYVTSPVTKLGQIIFGIGCGVITVVIRYFGGYPEGVSYAILVMNCCVVLLDKLGRPVKFGAPKKEAAK